MSNSLGIVPDLVCLISNFFVCFLSAAEGHIGNKSMMFYSQLKMITVFKILIWGGNRQICGRKFSFTGTPEQSGKAQFLNVYPTIFLPKLKL